MSDFENCLHPKKITFWFFLLRENDIFWLFRAFLKNMILNWNFLYVADLELKNTTRHNLNLRKYNASDFELKNTTRHFLSLKKYNASDFELKKLQRVRFWVYFFRSLPISHSFIKTGHFSVIIWCMVWFQLVKLFC